jgi:3-methylcrotonyl-CoA carboxylase beta subunit
MWPNARISVMGGEAGRFGAGHGEARRHGRRGPSLDEGRRRELQESIRAQYERQGHPYYASARLWDDGVIDPADTRRVLGLALSAFVQRAIEKQRFGVFRM